MFCSNCGYENNEATGFCPNCGTRLVQRKPIPSVKATTVQTPEKPRKSKKKIVIAIVSVLAAISLLAVLIITSIVVFIRYSYRCDDCSKLVLFQQHIIWDEDGDFSRWVCRECHDVWLQEEYGITYSGEFYNDEDTDLNDDENIEDIDMRDNEITDSQENQNTEDVVEEIPETEGWETEIDTTENFPEMSDSGEYFYEGETFDFWSTVYMDEFAEDHSNDNLQFYEWKGEGVELEIEVFYLPEGFADEEEYMTNLEDWYGEEIYTDAWEHVMPMEAGDMETGCWSECWLDNEVIIVNSIGNYLYVFQIFSDDEYYRNELYKSIEGVGYYE